MIGGTPQVANSVTLREDFESIGGKLGAIVRHQLFRDPVATDPLSEDIQRGRHCRGRHHSDLGPLRVSVNGHQQHGPLERASKIQVHPLPWL